MGKIRNLREDEIECKVSSIDEKGLQLLLYKTARTDKAILDEVYGEDGWWNEFEEIKGNLYCSIYVWSEGKKQWIKKQDCGVESAFGDKEKGEASDAFKRARFQSTVFGTELYTPIFIYVPYKDKNGKENFVLKQDNKTGKYKTYTKFNVEKIDTSDDKVIKQISIVNDKGKRVFVKASPVKAEPKKEQKKEETK